MATNSKEYGRKWYHEHKAERRRAVREQQERRKDRWFEFKRGLKCTFCAESESCCLQFHHLDPIEKEENLASAYRNWSWAKLMKEVAKCLVVCANCHFKIHAGIIDAGIRQEADDRTCNAA